MADILAFNLTQTHGGKHAPRKMNSPDLSTRLKLMGVDVASFGDHFADVRDPPTPVASVKAGEGEVEIAKERPSKHRKIDGPVKCLTYHDPFSATYKKYIFTEDGQYLLGGMMIGDVGDFTKLVAITKKKASRPLRMLGRMTKLTKQKKLDVPPSQFILGTQANGDANADELDEDATICSCHVSESSESELTVQNVSKGAIVTCVKGGMKDLGEIKKKTKAGAGCGGCVPLVTSIFKGEMKKAGHALSVA
jgi:nitrite reductase (NAD(P)H)